MDSHQRNLVVTALLTGTAVCVGSAVTAMFAPNPNEVFAWALAAMGGLCLIAAVVIPLLPTHRLHFAIEHLADGGWDDPTWRLVVANAGPEALQGCTAQAVELFHLDGRESVGTVHLPAYLRWGPVDIGGDHPMAVDIAPGHARALDLVTARSYWRVAVSEVGVAVPPFGYGMTVVVGGRKVHIEITPNGSGDPDISVVRKWKS